MPHGSLFVLSNLAITLGVLLGISCLIAGTGYAFILWWRRDAHYRSKTIAIIRRLQRWVLFAWGLILGGMALLLLT